MRCFVYKGKRKPDTYLYIDRQDDFSCLPEEILRLMGKLELVLELDLDENTRLAQARAADVLAAIGEQGFYLQLPGEIPEMFR